MTGLRLFATFLSCLSGSEQNGSLVAYDQQFLSCLSGSEHNEFAPVMFEGFLSCLSGSELDATDVVSTISGGVAVVSSIGLAVLSLVVVVKLFKWARSAL